MSSLDRNKLFHLITGAIGIYTIYSLSGLLQESMYQYFYKELKPNISI